MTTGLITRATEGQEVSFDRLVGDIIRQARKTVPMDKGGMQRLLGNGGKFKEDAIVSLVRHSIADIRFELLTLFELTVPKGYDHNTQLATFLKFAYKESGRFDFCSGNITDTNYFKTTHKLIPGKTYFVKIFGIKNSVTSDDCMAFLKSQRAIFVGAQGISLARQLKKEQFLTTKRTVSFDKKKALWTDDKGYHRMPVMAKSDGYWEFSLSCFEHELDSYYSLLCFSDLSA